MGLHLPKTARRWYVVAVLGFSLMMLTGCSGESKEQAERWAMPADSPATVQGREIAELWKWSWVAALATGAVVWALIFFVSWRYRRRSESDIPVQTRYNLPLEIFYTIVPIIMVVVLFQHTIMTQNAVLEEVDPDHTIEVVGQQWSWTFNYTGEDVAEGRNVYTAGTSRDIPTLVLPVDEIVQFNLNSPDVIHSFWIPGFLMKMDVVPGRNNGFQVEPNRIGTYMGKCTELCGTYHSRMLFNVEVVSKDDYEQYLRDQIAAGFVSDEPLLGGSDARTHAGLNDSPGGTE